ncbi:MAG: 2-C-methyl-D-erythritol 2,4-cyclodiphosphate synthase [Methylacidiphilales bacterium]|nr:2-C-methyl-D-erythritol 2,4-cyclodiphosphate synthase [Candidatus Methylacidiphilales bacterium]MDW8349647.1 2-C-methyl-D-erythritol 2,4-cyclodiphosphate synthase [Verrucomicrobiae bacterium]
MLRIGIGYDVHRLIPARPLFLGGLHVPHSHGLEGHSDADVLLHAIADALLGALGEGDIGHHFPNTDPRWKNAPSIQFIDHITKIMNQKNATLHNIDATIIAESPKISPHIPAMKSTIASSLQVHPSQIGIKATTNENLGFLGRKEGIAAIAVALVNLP